MGPRVALRNVLRNRRRTAFSLAVIAVGVAMLALVQGFVAEALQSTQRSLATVTGAVQVADPKVLDGQGEGFDALMSPDDLAAVRSALEDQPEVESVTWELGFSGLIGDRTGSTLVIARGVVPEDCMGAYECIMTAGRPLEEDNAREIVLAEGLARRLGADVGARLNLATNSASGGLNAATVIVVGIARYDDSDLADQLAFVPLGFAQRLLRTQGVERVIVQLEDIALAAPLAATLHAGFANDGRTLAARTWRELNPTYDSLETFWRAFSGFVGLAVFVLVFFSVLEVLTMAFLERIREVATLRALGTSRGRVFGSLVLEGAFIGLMGGAVGVTVGALLGISFNAAGVAWTPPGAVLPQPIRVELAASVFLLPLFTALAATVFSSLYPASRNARITVAEALRSI